MTDYKPVSRITEFTAGPLAVCEDGDEFFGVCDPKRTIPTKSGRVLTASFCTLGDARLYAAAPDMYAAATALQMARNAHHEDPTWSKADKVKAASADLDAALSRARGETK